MRVSFSQGRQMLGLVALMAVVAMLTPEAVYAQDAFTNGATILRKLLWIMGGGAIIGGFISIIKAGMAANDDKQGGGEWKAGAMMGVVLIILGGAVFVGTAPTRDPDEALKRVISVD